MGAPTTMTTQQPTGKGGGQQPRFGQPNQYANTVGDAQYRPQQNSMMPQAQYIGAPMKQPFGFQSDLGTPAMNPGQFDQAQPTWAQLPGMNNQPMPMKQNFDQPAPYPVNAGPQPNIVSQGGGDFERSQNMYTGYGGNNGMMNQPNVIPLGGWDNAGIQRPQQSTGKGGKGQSSWQPFQSNSNWNQ